MFDSATWLNPPARCEVGARKLKVWTADKTDFWRETHYGFTRNSGHVFGVKVSDDFCAQVRVEGRFDVEYDQAGIMVYVDDSTWMKAGAEFCDGILSVSSVLTAGKSDWALSNRLATNTFMIRATVEAGVLFVHYSQDGLGWSLVRMAPFPSRGPFLVGPTCCSPNRSGLVVDFDSFEVFKASHQTRCA